jgi:hypothetical protein
MTYASLYPVYFETSPIALLNENSSPGATRTPLTREAASEILYIRLGIDPAKYDFPEANSSTIPKLFASSVVVSASNFMTGVFMGIFRALEELIIMGISFFI